MEELDELLSIMGLRRIRAQYGDTMKLFGFNFMCMELSSLGEAVVILKCRSPCGNPM